MNMSARVYPFPRGCPFELPDEFAWLRRNAPVSPVKLPNGNAAWLVTRFDEVRLVLTDERFSRRRVREEAVRRQGGATRRDDSFDSGMSVANLADHARWRRMVGKVVNKQLAESLRARVGHLVEETLDEVAAQARSGPPGASGSVDLMATFAFQLPIRVICELFDVPLDLQKAFHDWAASVRGAGSSMDAFGEAMQSLQDSAVELLDRAHVGHGSSTLGALMDVRDEDGIGLSDQELASTVLLLTIAGYETAAIQFGNGLFALLRHPEELARVQRDESSVHSTVEELLRYAQSSTGFAGMTHTTCDVELGGVTIPAGSAVLISLDSAGRDETRVDRPDTFDPSRGSARHHLAFGSGPHFCLGAPLARLELQEGVGRLLRRFAGLRLACGVDDVVFASNLFSHYPRELEVTWADAR